MSMYRGVFLFGSGLGTKFQTSMVSLYRGEYAWMPAWQAYCQRFICSHRHLNDVSDRQRIIFTRLCKILSEQIPNPSGHSLIFIKHKFLAFCHALEVSILHTVRITMVRQGNFSENTIQVPSCHLFRTRDGENPFV